MPPDQRFERARVTAYGPPHQDRVSNAFQTIPIGLLHRCVHVPRVTFLEILMTNCQFSASYLLSDTTAHTYHVIVLAFTFPNTY